MSRLAKAVVKAVTRDRELLRNALAAMARKHPDTCGLYDGPLDESRGAGSCTCGADAYNEALTAVDNLLKTLNMHEAAR